MEIAHSKTFYWYFKPIAVLCKLMGIFPLQNLLSSNDPKDLVVKVRSFIHLYSIGIFGFNIFMIYFFSGFMFDTENSSVYLFIVVYVIIGRSLLCFIFCVSHAKRLPKLIRLLDTFDKKKKPILIDDHTYNTWRYLTYWTILPIIGGSVVLGFSFYESMNIVLETMPPDMAPTRTNMAAIFFGMLSNWQVLPLLLYMYFAGKINYNFNIINQTLKRRGFVGNFFDENIKYPADMYKSLEYLRYMHNLLSQTVKELGKCYGNFMAIDQLCLIVMVIANVCTFINDRGHQSHLLAATFLNVLIVIWCLVISEEIKESGGKVVDFLQGIEFSRIDMNSRMEIQTFLMQLAAQPIEVRASGYFTIDKKQIPSVLSSIATYLIVSLQFLDESKVTPSMNCTESTEIISI